MSSYIIHVWCKVCLVCLQGVKTCPGSPCKTASQSYAGSLLFPLFNRSYPATINYKVYKGDDNKISQLTSDCKLKASSQAKARAVCISVWLHTTTTTTHQLSLLIAVSQPPVVRSEHVRTFFYSTESQVCT